MNIEHKILSLASEIFAYLSKHGLEKEEEILNQVVLLVKKKMEIKADVRIVYDASWIPKEKINDVLILFHCVFDAITFEGIVIEDQLKKPGMNHAMITFFAENISQHICDGDILFLSEDIDTFLAQEVSEKLGVECSEDGNVAIMIYVNDRIMWDLMWSEIKRVYTIFDLREDTIDYDLKVISGVGLHETRKFMKDVSEMSKGGKEQ
ncbi:MAG: hypothetical protein OEV93_01520 [Candidatus Moranbacteria bacterium]|nr:hypothetical protein [Candidatus Moranbacteria bacterium]